MCGVCSFFIWDSGYWNLLAGSSQKTQGSSDAVQNVVCSRFILV